MSTDALLSQQVKQKLKEISNLSTDAKQNQEVLLRLSKLTTDGGDMDKLIQIENDMVAEINRSEMLNKLDRENENLHWKLGHKRVCDECAKELQWTEQSDCKFCVYCNDKSVEGQDSPSWHWEDVKRKQYMVLGIKRYPVDPNTLGIIDEQDNPFLRWNLEGAYEIKGAYDKEWKDDFPNGVAEIVELKEI